MSSRNHGLDGELTSRIPGITWRSTKFGIEIVYSNYG